MHFDTLQSLSLNGTPGKPNDDRCGAVAHLAWVVDGATDMGAPGLLGAQGGAAWLASTASAYFAASDKAGIRETCTAVFGQIEAQFERQRTRQISAPWEVPKAAYCAAQLTGQGLGLAWAADSPILCLPKSGDAFWATGAPDTGAERADALALGVGVGAMREVSDAVLQDRRAHRVRADHEALSAYAEPSLAVSHFAQLPIATGDELLLMSDGFARLVTDFERYTPQTLAAALRRDGLVPLAQELRTIEQQDAACLAHPRFKISDDATALWLRVC